jgi:hypothetical protein
MQVKLQRSNCNLYSNDEMYNLKIATNKNCYEVQTQVSGYYYIRAGISHFGYLGSDMTYTTKA